MNQLKTKNPLNYKVKLQANHSIFYNLTSLIFNSGKAGKILSQIIRILDEQQRWGCSGFDGTRNIAGCMSRLSNGSRNKNHYGN